MAATDDLSAFHKKMVTNFLTRCCGLSPAPATVAASKLCSVSRNPTQSVWSGGGSIIAFFQSYFFTPSQISKVISTCPRFLLSFPRRTFQPKMNFLLCSGFCPVTLTKLITSDACILASSLKNRIIPSFDFLKTIVLTEENVVAAVMRSPRMLRVDLKAKLTPKILLLLSIGVNLATIAKIVIKHPSVLMQSSARFGESLDRVLSMGFSPSADGNFIRALHSVSAISVDSFQRKLEACKSFGLTEDKMLSYLKKNPRILSMSEENIRRSFGFFMEKLNWNPEFVLSYHVLLMLSLKKRIAPRLFVYETLVSKGLLTEKAAISPQLFLEPEEVFLLKYLHCFRDECPDLLEAYNAMG